MMDDCVIQFHPTTGQLMVHQGEDNFGAMFDSGSTLQAYDRQTGARYMLSVRGEEVEVEKVTLH